MYKNKWLANAIGVVRNAKGKAKKRGKQTKAKLNLKKKKSPKRASHKVARRSTSAKKKATARAKPSQTEEQSPEVSTFFSPQQEMTPEVQHEQEQSISDMTKEESDREDSQAIM